jgi:hypothetical protein
MYAGLPWLLFLRDLCGNRVHFWPFDGWRPPPGRSVVAEVWPPLWSRSFPQSSRDPHQHDAYSIAAWLRSADVNASLDAFFHPDLDFQARSIAAVEGWILGVA